MGHASGEPFSGQAISGAIDNAIAEGFSDGGGSWSARTTAASASTLPPTAAVTIRTLRPKVSSTAPFSDLGQLTRQRCFRCPRLCRTDQSSGSVSSNRARLARLLPVRGTALERWVCRRYRHVDTLWQPDQRACRSHAQLAPNFLIGAFGGYETFDYIARISCRAA